MLINESAGSGGDALPYMFRLRKIGPLIGTRTWGGLVGTLGIPATIDGGGITAPSLAFYNLKSREWVSVAGVATVSTDRELIRELLGFMRRSVDEFGQTIVMVTHDPVAASYADRVVFLADGRVVDELAAPRDVGVRRQRGVVAVRGLELDIRSERSR